VSSRPEAHALSDFLRRAARRLAWSSVAEGAAAGFIVALLVAIVFWIRGESRTIELLAIGVVLAALGVAVRLMRSRDERRRVAYVVERRVPASKNLVVTASELDRLDVAPHVADLVLQRATHFVSALDVDELFPLRNAGFAAATALAAWAVTIAIATTVHATPAAWRSIGSPGGAALALEDLRAEITPPVYAKRARQTIENPARIEMLAGSKLHLVARVRASRVVLETLDRRDTVAVKNGSLSVDLTPTTDGYVVLEPLPAGERKLIGLSVTPDAPPRARITAPGKDLFLDDPHRTLDVAIDATDDIGLATLALKYTKVAGSGERFTFTEGTVPIQVTRTSARAWAARARWNLDSLGLAPGDMIVYRAVATDQRPGAPPSESDSYIAEILIGGGGAAAGFSVDPEQERYAVSQQMVILKTERLAARKAQMSADEYANGAAELAAEQRKVRAQFVFMMGGELADAPDPNGSMTDLNEEAEAEGEDDLLAGRNANKGRVALLRAIRSMSRAATSLDTADLPGALPQERAALASLESAFSHARILLRALSEREQLDLTRRLTGVLNDASTDVRPIAPATENVRTTQLRAGLSGVASLAGSTRLDARAATTASMLAEQVLRVDASDRTLQGIASVLSDASRAIARGKSDDAHRLLEQAAASIASVLRGTVMDAPMQRSSFDVDRTRGALTDALRGTGTPR